MYTGKHANTNKFSALEFNPLTELTKESMVQYKDSVYFTLQGLSLATHLTFLIWHAVYYFLLVNFVLHN
jgi:hypothetical protein